MIDSAAIERAENVLQVVYGGDLGRQLTALQVERETIDNVIQHCWDVIDGRNPERAAMAGTLTAGINTMLVHMFLLGLISGRNSVREIL
jgi:hypothetical protein